MRCYGKTPEYFKVEVVEEVVVVDAKEEEWNHEIEVFLQQLDDGQEEAPKEVERLPELKELPPKWKYVFLGGDSKKPVVINSLLTPLEEEDLLQEVEKVSDGLEWDLDGVIPIYCLHTPKKDEDLNPVVQLEEVPTPTLQALVNNESVELDETDIMSTTSDSFRVNSIHVTSKNEGSKKPPKRSSKKKRTKWKTKGESLKSYLASVKSLLVDLNIAPLKEEHKRSRIESKLK
ncbi:hypothetical protein A2U01_0022072 [Trifolium medium]|uniref:Uncharacterized protein n=1 Tax=Trifolium medium TaxID=97028 RepID=A0A392NMD5_9FABA|nr:hypothetical protein [Trifolium medium]